MAGIKLTRELAQRASWDAANAAMRAGGRKAWNEEDYSVCVAEFDRLWPLCPHGVEPQDCYDCYQTVEQPELSRVFRP
jgi:hypothetical protein